MSQRQTILYLQLAVSLTLVAVVSCDDDKDHASNPAATTDQLTDASTHGHGDSDDDAGGHRDEPPSASDANDKPKPSSDSGADASAPAKDAGEHSEDAGADEPHPQTCSVKSSALATTIWLVLDGSASMVDMLGDVSRWQALKDALMDPNKGVVKALERDVKWGLWMFDGPEPGNFPVPLPDGGTAMFTSPPATTCPRVVSVDPALENYQAITKAYPPDPLGGSTPSDKALEGLIAKLGNTAEPTSIVFATDGAPNDMCSMAFPPPDVAPFVVAAVKKLAERHIPTYVISLAGEDQMLMQHLTDVAQSGATNLPPFAPQNSGDLLTALRGIVGNEASCTLRLEARVKAANRCDAKLELGNSKLGCDAADGYSLEAPSTLRLQGNACTRYKADKSSLHIEIPCDALETK